MPLKIEKYRPLDAQEKDELWQEFMQLHNRSWTTIFHQQLYDTAEIMGKMNKVLGKLKNSEIGAGLIQMGYLKMTKDGTLIHFSQDSEITKNQSEVTTNTEKSNANPA